MSGKKGVQLPARRIQNAFVVLLLAVFAGCGILLTAMGAGLYRDTVAHSDQNNSDRILAAIVRGAAHSEDAGTVKVERFEDLGIVSLTFTNDYDGEIYYRRLFCADGALRESYTSADYEFTPDQGDPLYPAEAFEPRLDGSLLTARITTAEGTTQEISVSLRAGGAAQ